MGWVGLWWVWMAAALGLALLELVAPAYIFLGFAIGAALVGLLLLLPFTPGLPLLLTLFAIFSLLAWAALRHVFRNPKGQARIVRHDIND